VIPRATFFLLGTCHNSSPPKARASSVAGGMKRPQQRTLHLYPRKEVEGLCLRAAAKRGQPEANEGLKIKGWPISAPSPQG
jgi:hypothetical protein